MLANNSGTSAELEAEMNREFNIRSLTLKDKADVFKESLGYVPSPGGMTPTEMTTVVTYLKEERSTN